MNHSLTLYLAILGGAVLAVVVAHGAWTSRRAAARQPRRATVEPVDGSLAGASAGATSLDEIPTLPMDDGEVAPAASPAASLPPVRRTGPRLEAIVLEVNPTEHFGVLPSQGLPAAREIIEHLIH